LQALVQVSSSGDGRICSAVMFARESNESKYHKSLGRLTNPQPVIFNVAAQQIFVLSLDKVPRSVDL
jgi:hypothetical protein